MARMLIEDTFVVPGVGVVVTGRPEAGDIREGDRLWLDHGTARQHVTVREVLHFCAAFIDRKVALAGMNTSLVLDGVPAGTALPGRWLSSEIDGNPPRNGPSH